MFELDPITLSRLGQVSFALGLLAYAPYIRDILAGRTQPQRSSWLIWAVVASIALASQIAEGASHSLWLAAANWGVTVTITSLSVRFGSGSYLKDWPTLALAACALLLWYATQTPAYAIGLAILANTLGTSLTVLKAYRSPHTETLGTWLAGGVSAALGLAAVGALDVVLMAYPAYLVLLYLAVTTAICLGRLRAPAKAVPVPEFISETLILVHPKRPQDLKR